ncbi:hypothetical protein FN846DRAFT_498299 [Sphaerosporella brunnea]|uniref:Uncharacterized protein n=1 Tax=Sphaerosporella brunnea TaxID=1250544 RepID=A0A5J5F473_9PEZI|nr:hypothetical protein FN846DRAFT_498299 [Sphaerosporella brunnea]
MGAHLCLLHSLTYVGSGLTASILDAWAWGYRVALAGLFEREETRKKGFLILSLNTAPLFFSCSAAPDNAVSVRKLNSARASWKRSVPARRSHPGSCSLRETGKRHFLSTSSWSLTTRSLH